MWRRRASAAVISLGVLLAACGGGGGLSDEEAHYCLVQGPGPLQATADVLGVDLWAAFDAAREAGDAAKANGANQLEELNARQAVMEGHPNYIEVCRDLYEHK